MTLPPADTSRLLKKSASIVLASLPGTVKRETRVSRGAADLPADKARPQGIEAVLADSGWAGEVAARVGRVRSLAFLNILLRHSPTSQDVPVIEFKKA